MNPIDRPARAPRGGRPRHGRLRLGRLRLGRLRRSLLAALLAASLAAPVMGAARPAAVPAPDPGRLPPLTDASPATLARRYAATHDAVRAAQRMAAGHGDRRRASMLAGMADPARRFLSFDGRDGGRAVEVFGDLADAGTIAVVVPGADTNLDKYGLLRGGSMRLHAAIGGRSAVVAWLGYRTPSTLSLQSLTADLADAGVPALRAFVRELAAIKPGARVSLVCHSYGSVVCGRAASGLDVADLVLYGSAGVTAETAAGLRTRATVWAGVGAGDWISEVPNVRWRLPFATVGLGADPVSPGFGARVFPAGNGGHSDYLRAGSVALENIARIVSGGNPLPAGADG
ncbi:alpha/beta hydrolase [Nonomuraea antri]|uniref:alpha/beta hydrolase n=1 Tax=Nonomuraea antri TaxID=2730852 RepID=UPI002E2A382F|nr:alpha/beta hydrolase [Nonomuraea antri]